MQNHRDLDKELDNALQNCPPDYEEQFVSELSKLSFKASEYGYLLLTEHRVRRSAKPLSKKLLIFVEIFIDSIKAYKATAPDKRIGCLYSLYSDLWDKMGTDPEYFHNQIPLDNG